MNLLRPRIPFVILFWGVYAQLPAQEPSPSSELLRNAAGENSAFAAVGRLRASLTCTGSLIDPSGAGAPDATAWLLTAGHCISLEPYGVIRNQALTASVEFNYFTDTPDRRVTVQSRTVGWSTMKSADLALVELDSTLGELFARGIRPLRLASATPADGRPAFWTGISGSPIPPELQFLRLGRCILGERVPLLEGSWIWKDELSNNCPDLYEGASGSPLFDAGSSEVIGVIGTSTLLNFEQGPDYDCQTNRPCVARAGGPVMERDTSYASPVEGIARCFDQANGLELRRLGCPLDPGFQLTVRSGSTEVRPEVEGKPATWDAALSGSQQYYAYKRFPMGEGDCASLSGYSAPLMVAAAPVIGDRIGSADGYYFLCVIAGDTPSFDPSWQQPSYASIRFKRLDSQAPLVLVDYQIVPLIGSYQLVNLTGSDGTSDFGIGLSKRGSPSATDCSDPLGYQVMISIPDVVRTSDIPLRICWKLSDKAGNFNDPAIFDFGPPAMLPNATRNAASLNRGTVAASSVFQVDTFELTDRTEYSPIPVATLAGVQMSVRDGAGRTLPVPMTLAGPLFLEAVMPADASPGEATLVVQPPRAPAISQPVTIRPSAPGLYSDAATGYASDSNGNLFPFTTCPNGQQCYATHLPLSSTAGGLDFVLYGTGLRGASAVRMRIGTHTVNSVTVRPHDGIAGVDDLSFHLPQDFPLRLFQAIAAETSDGTSNYLWIYLE